MTQASPDAELLIAPGCPHCPAVLAGLTELVKRGRIGRLQVVNLASHPEEGEARHARGVPWIRIGPFRLTGAHTPAELEDWAARAASRDGQRDYLAGQLADGALDDVTAACRAEPQLLPPLLDLAADLETPLAVRIGVGAVIEELAGTAVLHSATDDLLRLSTSAHAAVRADAAHYLGLAPSPAAHDRLLALRDDPDPEVREIAAESLAHGAAGDAR